MASVSLTWQKLDNLFLGKDSLTLNCRVSRERGGEGRERERERERCNSCHL